MTENEKKETRSEKLGEFLVARREARGLSREALAEEIKISVEMVEFIENGEWKKFPVEAYLRGYLNSIATKLGLDKNEILIWYGKESGSTYTHEFSESADEDVLSGVGIEQKKSRGGLILTIVVLLAILGILLYVMGLAERARPMDEQIPDEIIEKATLDEPALDESTLDTFDSLALSDSLLQAGELARIDSIVKSNDLPASATIFLSADSKEETPAKENSKAPSTTIELSASEESSSWVGVKKQVETELYAKQVQLSKGNAEFSYSGKDTLFVVIGNSAAIVSMKLNGKKSALPVNSHGKSLKMKIYDGKIIGGF